MDQETAQASAQTDYSLKRLAERRRVLKGARLYYNDGKASLDCTIRDVSTTGARFRLQTPAKVPEDVMLMLKEGHERLPGRTVWFHGTEIGVKFNAGVHPSFAPPESPLIQVLQTLHDLNAAEMRSHLEEAELFEDEELREAFDAWAAGRDQLLERLEALRRRS